MMLLAVLIRRVHTHDPTKRQYLVNMSHDCQENADHDVVYDVCPHSATGAHIQGMEAYKAMYVLSR